MTEEIDSGVIKKTQEILGSVIRKPALTEKSLKKPPFRFLHDIITNVIKSSGFFKGLYTQEELQSDNVKDKESKILFLQKAIDVLTLATNQPVNLKPSKVVAGHEPQKTNLFLQIIGTAVKNKVDSKEAVEKVLNGKLQASPTKAPKDRRASVDRRTKAPNEKSHSRSLTKTLDPVKKSTSSNQSKETGSKSKDGEKVKEKSREKREKSRDRSKPKEETKKPPKDKSPKKNVDEQPDTSVSMGGDFNGESSEQLAPGKTEVVEAMQPEPSTSMMNGDAHEKEDPGDPEGDSHREKREKSHRPHSSRSARPPSASRIKRTKPPEVDSASEVLVTREPVIASHSIAVPPVSEQNFENTLLPSFRPPSTRPPSARPSSSRPAPPRIRIKHVVENQEPELRPATAKPVENVILDQSQLSDEEETFLVMETETTDNLEIQQSTKSLPAETPEEDKGSLVKKLLETKKDLEGGSQHTPTKKAEIDPMASHRLEHERNSASKELSQLRGWVQSLSRSAVPLGRMLDFLQEDVDAMRMELHSWREEHRSNLAQLHKEQSATESLLEPLRAQLDDLDQVVQNQLDANSALKASIAKNDERIQRMLNSVNHKS